MKTTTTLKLDDGIGLQQDDNTNATTTNAIITNACCKNSTSKSIGLPSSVLLLFSFSRFKTMLFPSSSSSSNYAHHYSPIISFIFSLVITLVLNDTVVEAASTETELQPSLLTSMASISGYLATFCFTVQYIPQAYLNYKRKSVKGFSTTGILLKLIGSAYLGVNSYLMGEALSVVLYGAFNIAQHVIFMIQFTIFTNRKIFLLSVFIPIIPLFCGVSYPDTIPYTNLIKPISQIVSHIPQLLVTWEARSTEGISLASNHLNLLGGMCGIFMYSVFTPKSFFTRLVYWNSMLQASSMYFLAVYFDGWERLRNSFSSLLETEPDVPANAAIDKESQFSTGVTTSTMASSSSLRRELTNSEVEITSITKNVE